MRELISAHSLFLTLSRKKRVPKIAHEIHARIIHRNAVSELVIKHNK